MNFLRTVAALFLPGKKPAVVPFQLPAAPVASQWMAFDRDNLRRFLESDTGRKLVDRLRATQYLVAVSNARDQFHADHAAGQTCGYSDCLKQLFSLSVSCADSQVNDSGELGEVRPVEREMDEYLNRMSP